MICFVCLSIRSPGASHHDLDHDRDGEYDGKQDDYCSSVTQWSEGSKGLQVDWSKRATGLREYSCCIRNLSDIDEEGGLWIGLLGHCLSVHQSFDLPL
jgi:hypothetical protein